MFTTLAVAAALAAPVPKAPAPELKWRLAKGDAFYVTMTTDGTTTANNVGGGGGAVVQGTTSAGVVVFKATVAAADDKGCTLQVEILSCKTGTGNAGGAVQLADQPDAVGKKAVFTFDPAFKVTRSDGADKLMAAGGLMTAENFSGNLQDLLRAVPGKALAGGGTWKGEEELPFSDGIVNKRTDRGKVAGTEDGLVKLEVETDHLMTGGPKGGGFTFDLKGEKGTRTVLFDPKAGRVRKVVEQYSLSGNIGLGGGGGGGNQNITLTIGLKATVTVSDDPPKADR